MIWGAIAGDIIGSRFEFDNGGHSRRFNLFTEENNFTDDTVMTMAVANALLGARQDATPEEIKTNLIMSMQCYGFKYPNAGYGANFAQWLYNPVPYNSFGNGSAMRVSPVGWLYDDLERTLEVAKYSAEISHNHPEGIKGARCTAMVIWMARHGYSKDEIMTCAVEDFGYDLSKSVDEWIPLHEHNESCMDALPKALIAFYEGENFEQVIRNAVAMGGDADTIAAIAGSMAEAMYKIPVDITKKCREILGWELTHAVDMMEIELLMKNIGK